MGALLLRSLVLLIASSALVTSTEQQQQSTQDEEAQPNYQVGRVIRQIFGRDHINQQRFQPIFPAHQQQFNKPSFGHTGKLSNPSFSGNTINSFGGGCNCVHLVACPGGGEAKYQGCSLKNGAAGICCPDTPGSPPWGGITRLFESPQNNIQMRDFSSNELNQACQKGARVVRSIKAIELELMGTRTLKKGTPASGHQRFFSITRSARDGHHGAMAISEASMSMKRDFRLDHAQSCIGLRKFSAKNTILAGNCPALPRCKPHAKYRTLDGTCNNIHHPLWGKSETAFQRILPAKYDDGVRSPRTRSVLGTPLPNERRISNHVLIDFDNPDPQFTLSVMQWGQFLDHDMSHTPFASFDNNEGKECCRNGQFVRPQLLEDCWPISIPRDDEFYSRRGQRCMNFVRSMLGEDEECGFGCAEQMNQITHWLDGSNIYGSSVREANGIRDRKTGFLKVSRNNMLPYESKRSHDCEAAGNSPCFAAGDSRVNEQPGLIAIHAIWHREHNRVANHLRHMNPHWTPDAVYQEARRIVIAEYQHIAYNEWMPIIVGEPFMKSFDISPKRGSYSLDYSHNVNPNVNNEFACSAFRFGHTLVQGTMNLVSRSGVGQLRLKDHFNSPHLFQRDPEMMDKFSRMFAKQNIQRFDSFITKELTNHLFETPETDFGMDLMSLNIHRGRDHAIATYNEMRQVCGLKAAHNFNDLLDQIPPETVRRLADVYQSVDDIDFFVGGISERPVSGGLLGWTFLCVVGDQFARVKKGDRYFYDLQGTPGSFKPHQLEEIKKASWARILCDNSDMGVVQPLAFRLPSHLNPEVPCHSPSIPRVNLQFWRGEHISIF